MLCFQKKLQKKKVEVEKIKPTGTQYVTVGWLHNKLVKAGVPSNILYLSDSKLYRLPSYDDIALFLARSHVDKEVYEDETFDCDDFALALAGEFSVKPWAEVTFGLIWTNTHAFNIFVTEDDVFYVEPQSDEISRGLFGTGTKYRFVMV